MGQQTFIAVDWGTTNRRAYRIENGVVVETERDSLGVTAVPSGGFEAEVIRLRDRHGGAPVLLAGMVGSNRGWVDAGYVPTPATLDALAAAVVKPMEDVLIIPGVRHVAEGRGDVMRGEEVQLLGALAAGLAPADALLCQPGTHCKWAWMEDGALSAFVTAMTGEMFALLKNHALIGQEMTGEVTPGDAFVEGVREAARGDLLASLFGVRPASLLGLRDRADAAAFVSGLLIGTDCAAHAGTGEVHLLADPALGALYGRAITELGGTPLPVDSHAAFVAGATRLWEYLS
ncbi:MAG TPA: 2-oxo-3-deoxygalactonate kinase [Sphingobium sp.]|jgi:2-dehydro-3-deoxygalactonokinase|uniref:2-dehydro-3-deoxygalactonokinase n=1 Tax=Sphingobium sp. TaxID=1912891 RepID=UPI000EC7EFA3|nr:2-dehydro-3-deoxygalactonokinase [Sphingobium sp.]HAF42757.1 2-oxo-3-deoxygalactonate kinase [Sphingobium sp.]